MRARILAVAFIAAALIVTFSSCGARKPAEAAAKYDFDIIIAGGEIVDGTGIAPSTNDLGIRDGFISEIGDLSGKSARRRIDASGLVVMPGIIDVHSHADGELVEIPDAPNLALQGITTVVTGNCGGSEYPVGEFFEKLEQTGTTLNVAHLIGHNTVRGIVMGMEARKSTPEELERMKELVRAGMEEGAIGLSTGLKYTPGVWADTDEVVELSKVAAKSAGFYTTHMRDEGRGVVESVRETLEIGRRARIPVQISHHKVASRDCWGDSVKTLALVDEARKAGQTVYIDQYPYPATSTGLTVLFPPWSLEGGRDAVLARINDPETRAKIVEGIVDNILHDRGGSDPSNILIARCPARPEAEGKNISELLEKAGREVNLEQAAELIIDILTDGGAQAIYFCLCDDDIERIMHYPATMIATDSHICEYGIGSPHPRNYGTFPRVFSLYVREKGVLGFSEAVKKMTALPAQAFTLRQRGIIQPTFHADIVVIDRDTVADTSTWTEPHSYPVGIEYVIVNGVVVAEGGKLTGARPGQMLRHRGPVVQP